MCNIANKLASLSSVRPPKNTKFYTFEEIFLICEYKSINYKNIELLKMLNLLCEDNIHEYEGFLSFSTGVSYKYLLKSISNSYKNIPDLRNL